MTRHLNILLMIVFGLGVLTEVVNITTGDGGSPASPFILVGALIGLILMVIRLVRAKRQS